MNVQEFNFSVDVLQSILWQYGQATNLLALLNDKQAWLDENQSNFWFNPNASTDETGNGWYQNVFNLLTANNFGLAVWSIILDVPLYVPTSKEPANTDIFGFNFYSGYTGNLNFFNANFSNLNSVIQLTTEEQRFLLRLRYYQLITRDQIYSPQAQATIDPTPYDINSFLNYLCTNNDIGYSGTIYVVDNLDMTITYYFTRENFPSALMEAISDLDLFPRPAGVLLNEFIIITGELYFLNTNVFTLLNGNPLVLL